MQLVQVNKKNCRSFNGWELYLPNGEKLTWVEQLVLINCRFVVDQELKTTFVQDVSKRFRHAWVEGEWLEGALPDVAMKSLTKVEYYPKKDEQFKRLDNQQEILLSEKAYFFRDGVYV